MNRHAPPSHEAIEDALALWRDGWKQTRRPNLPAAWRAEYLGAVAAVYTTALQQYTTMAELVAAYYASPPVAEATVEQVLHPASGHILNAGLVEDAAYWRRARQLLQADDRE